MSLTYVLAWNAQVATQNADFIHMITVRIMDDLLAVVGRERQILERLLYRLLQTSNMITIDETRFLHWLALDLERVADHLREIDLQRSIIAVGLEGEHSTQQSLPSQITMTTISANAPTPYRFLLDDHQSEMSALVGEVGTNVAHIRDLIEERLNTLACVPSKPCLPHLAIHNHHDDLDRMDALDREILNAGYETILLACDRLQLPELVRFLEC